ncbi:MAG: hypothetical protein J5585_07900 [Clostridia bacterium]|nr:hypothetical protein [Clostridia bacterium]
MSSQALIDKILATAKDEAEQITNEFMRRAAENEKLMLDRAADECRAIEAESILECEQIKRIAELTSGLESRKARLHCRRGLIDEAFGKAYKKVLSLQGSERASFLKSLIVKYAPAKEFIARTSPADAGVVTALLPELQAALGDGTAITVQADEAVKAGVYMSSEYSDVDCTIDAIFDELRDGYEAKADAIMSGDGV